MDWAFIMSRQTVNGISLVLLSGASWGVISLFIRRLSIAGFSAMDISALRSILSCIILVIVIAIIKPNAFFVRLKDLWCMVGCGIFSLTLFNISYFYTMQHTSVAIAVVLLYTSPIFVTLLSRLFFREKLRKWAFLALGMVSLGCVLVSGALADVSSSRLSFSTLLAGLASGLCYGLFSIFGRFAQNRGYSTYTITLWTFILAVIPAIFLLNWRTASANIHGSVIFTLVGLAIVSTVLPYFAYTAGLRLLTPTKAAIFATLEPIVGTIVGITVFHEPLTINVAFGIVLILGAMFLPVTHS